MGLLLGASVMTICEVLDLFLYNGIAKLVKKLKRMKENWHQMDGKQSGRRKTENQVRVSAVRVNGLALMKLTVNK